MGVWNSMRHDARVARSAGTLSAAGADVRVVAASWDPSEWGPATHERGFNIITVPRRRPWALSVGGRGASLWGFVLRVFRTLPSQCRFMLALFRSRADIFHAHDLQALPWVWIVARLRRRPVIYDAHEISTDRTSLKRLARMISVVEGFLARRSSAMITTTDMRADYFVEQYGVSRPLVLQNRPHFRAVQRSNRLREKLGIKDKLPLVLYQGGLQPGRGLERLVELIPEVVDARFVFLGGGVLRKKLEARAAELGEEWRTHFLPAVPWEELAEWTASADIGVQLLENTCLNHYTTDSNKIFEYAMAGLPVLASDFPEIRRIVLDNGFGFVVDPGDSTAIRSSLRSLVTDSNTREILAEAAVRRSGSLSWETQEPELMNLYRHVLRGTAEHEEV